MKSIKTLIVMLLFITASVSVYAQNENYSGNPGYVNFSDLLSLKSGDLVTEVFIEEPLLKMVAKMASSKKEDVSKAIGGLKLVSVKEFMVDEKNSSQLESKFASFDKILQNNKWTRIVRTKTHGKLANVYVKEGKGDSYDGLVVTAMDKDGKVSLVNIVGTIDLETIGGLSDKFNIPEIDSIKHGGK